MSILGIRFDQMIDREKSALVSVQEKQFKKFPTDFGIKEREMYADIVIWCCYNLICIQYIIVKNIKISVIIIRDCLIST